MNRFQRRVLRSSALALAASMLGAVTAAHEPGAHVHGVAELRVVFDGDRVEIALESPLENVLGFEHAPRNDNERMAVRTMVARLREAQKLFVTAPAAGCVPGAVQLVSAALPADLLGEPEPVKGEGGNAEAGHADLDASFTFQCASPAGLKGMEVGLMQAFPAIRRLNVQVVGPKGQSATVLVSGQRAVAW